jgi:hypothetical protein
MTTYGDGLFQYGGMPVGGGMLPLMGGGNGNGAKVYFVDPANGSAGNDGLSPDSALVTVGAAYAKCVDKSGDTIYFLNDGNTTGSSREATIPLTWSKDNVHLVGLCAPTFISQRSRITPVSTAALTAAPVIDVTGNGNIFANLQIAHFGADTDSIGTQGVAVSGDRNYFHNVHIVGIVNDHTGDEATGVDLLIDGGSENLFKHCTIGVDTVVRTAANASIELTTQATRNVFEDCYIPMVTDAADPLFVKADGSGDLDRFTIFRGCTFVNGVESGATSLTAAVNVHNTAGGMVMFHNCQIAGADDVATADNGNVWVDGVGGAATGSLSIIATQ